MAGAGALVIDDLSRGARAHLQEALGRGVRLLRLDVRDSPAIHLAFQPFQPQLVFHLAAQIDVRTSIEEPTYDATVNVLGSLNVFAAAHAARASSDQYLDWRRDLWKHCGRAKLRDRAR